MNYGICVLLNLMRVDFNIPNIVLINVCRKLYGLKLSYSYFGTSYASIISHKIKGVWYMGERDNITSDIFPTLFLVGSVILLIAIASF